MSREKREVARASPTRLAAVRATGLLDAEATEALNRYSRLAAQLLGVPAAFLSLVDAERDFYVSQCGFSEALAAERELQGTTFCHFGLVSDGPVVIHDTSVDPEHRAVPTVQSLGVAAYLGIPIRGTDSEVIGSLCAIDVEPRCWSARDLEVLSALAEGAQREISLLMRVGDSLREADQAIAARRTLEIESQARQRILETVAHDLRTPLSTLSLIHEALAASVVDARGARRLAIARRQTSTMIALIQDLLEDARLRGGKAQLVVEPVALHDFLRELAADFEPMALQAAVNFETAVAPDRLVATFDRRRMTQVCRNLISNAFRFTPAGGMIRVDARIVEENLEIEVRDTGQGIDSSLIPHIFDAYTQGERSGGGCGLGLGLHIAREIVRLHGGEIAVCSAPGEGASFTIRVPLNRS